MPLCRPSGQKQHQRVRALHNSKAALVGWAKVRASMDSKAIRFMGTSVVNVTLQVG